MAKQWENRIVGYGEEDPEQLLANPSNWRVHPKSQQDALLAVMEEVGVVQDVIVNQQTGFLVDGHLRVVLAMRTGQRAIPVKYVDLSPEDETLILAVFDPIAGLAATDKSQLDALLHEIQTDQPAVMGMLAQLADQHHLYFSQQPPTPHLPQGVASSPSARPQPLDFVGEGADELDPQQHDIPGDQPILPASQVRMVQLFLSNHTHPEFAEMVSQLSGHFGTSNATDTVMEVLRYACGQLDLSDA
jgi:hypothetical protein